MTRPALLLAAAAALLPAAAGYVCEIPTSGCSNGMFNQELCKCECISPFCPDANGDCTVATGNCGGNPWADCVRGKDCPWWVNPLKAESCTTGPDIPAGFWNIYNTKTVCCNTNFAYSDACNAPPATAQPTKHPTMGAVEDDDYEIVPLKFDMGGLPDDIKMRELRAEMLTVMKRILLRLADRVPGLKISSVEEKEVLNKSLLRRLRALEKSVTLYYNVHVIRDPDKKFGPLIIQEIRDSYDEVLEQIQQFTDTKYFGGNLNLNWCTSQGGQFSNCVNEIFQPPPAPVRVPAPTPTVVFGSEPPPEESGGLAGWAVALIVISVLLLLCCIGYGVWASCYRDEYHKSKEFETNIYLDDKTRGGRSRRSRSSRSKRKSRSRQIVVAGPNGEEYYDDESFAVDSARPKRIGRDPTMYVPGQEEKPDPDSDILLLTDGTSQSGRQSGRRYYEDPPLKPKRDPTMYVDGESQPDPTMYVEGMSVEDASLPSKRDPTMYIEGETEEMFGNDEQMRAEAEDRYKMEGIDTSEEDRYGMEGEAYDRYDFGAVGRDPTYYSSGHGNGHVDGASQASFRTEEPSLASKRSERSKRSKKGRKQKRNSSGHNSDWGASMPEVGVRPKEHEARQNNSFYR